MQCLHLSGMPDLNFFGDRCLNSRQKFAAIKLAKNRARFVPPSEDGTSEGILSEVGECEMLIS